MGGKCKFVYRQNHSYEMNGQQLKHEDEEKYLGVLIDNDIKFHKQTAVAVKKGNQY